MLLTKRITLAQVVTRPRIYSFRHLAIFRVSISEFLFLFLPFIEVHKTQSRIKFIVHVQ